MKITKEQASKAKSIADQYAQELGKADIREVVEPIQANLNGSEVQQELGRVAARAVVENLTKLILRMELFTTPNPDYMDRVLGYFNDGVVKEGNAKIYRFNNPTGNSAYVNSEFVPSALTTTDVDEFKIGMYTDAQGLTLTSQGYQFRKTLVYIESQWIPYFKSGNLIQFIAELQENMNKTWKMNMFDRVMKLITKSTSGIGKQINGSTPNAFDAWALDILPEIRKMTTLSNTYNYNQTNTNLMLTNPSDLLIFAHPKTIQTLESGIKSQLFNAKFLDLKGILDESNFIDAGLQLTIPKTENTKITVGASYYIDETKIYVVSKHAIKHFSQIDRIETAFYGRNLAIEFTMHKWGALDFLPWGQAFVYTNTNLNTLP